MCLPHALQIVLICLGYHKCLIIPIFRHLTILGNRQNAQSTLWYYATVIQGKNKIWRKMKQLYIYEIHIFALG